MKKLTLLALLGAAIAYLRNASRRSALFGRFTSLFRRGGDTLSDAGQSFGGQASGFGDGPATQSFGGAAGSDALDDVTLARKVETEIFRAPDAPKGSVDVNVQEGVVQLRGEVERPELIDELVSKARSVQGVREVENLLHTPGTEAPMHQ